MTKPRWRIQGLDVTTSTNDDVRRAAEAGEPEGLVIVAARQTAGRGRQGRVWESPEGNLYCSILLRPKNMPHDAAFYSFVAALVVRDVVVEALRQGQSDSPPLVGGVRGGGTTLDFMSQEKEQGSSKRMAPHPNSPHKGEGISPRLPQENPPSFSVALKWPNDILVNGKKISGILLEVAGDALIIGIGLNVAHHPEKALYSATSLVNVLNTIEKKENGMHAFAGMTPLVEPPVTKNTVTPATVSAAAQLRRSERQVRRSLWRRRKAVVPFGLSAETLLNELLIRLSYWHGLMQAEGFRAIRSAWLEHAQQGRLNVRLQRETVQGSFAGLDEMGALRLLLDDGAERVISTGDVVLPPED